MAAFEVALADAQALVVLGELRSDSPSGSALSLSALSNTCIHVGHTNRSHNVFDEACMEAVPQTHVNPQADDFGRLSITCGGQTSAVEDMRDELASSIAWALVASAERLMREFVPIVAA